MESSQEKGTCNGRSVRKECAGDRGDSRRGTYGGGTGAAASYRPRPLKKKTSRRGPPRSAKGFSSASEGIKGTEERGDHKGRHTAEGLLLLLPLTSRNDLRKIRRKITEQATRGVGGRQKRELN